MSAWKLVIAVLASVVMSGCATSTRSYTPPTEVKIENNRVFNAQFDEVWNRLVRNLSSDFFVINNIDKNSRIINISFSSQNPSEFVDCGRTFRTFKNLRGTNNYDYATAESANFFATGQDGIAYNIKRTTKLEGRINIYVAPEEGGTVVNVNSKYILSVNAGFGNSDFDFSTKQGYKSSEMNCYARGSIEKKILDSASRQQ